MLVIAGRDVSNSGAYIPGSSTTTVQRNYNNTLTAKTTSNPDIPIYVANVRADLYLSLDGKHLQGFAGDGLTWKGAANDVAKQIDVWVGLNRQALERLSTVPQTVEGSQKNGEPSMAAVEAAFKARHPDVTPEMEKLMVDLMNSGKVDPGNTTPDEYLETLYEVVMARQTHN